jgi:hypothetical protein
LDEFPAGYSLTGLLSSTRASASPAGGEYALGLIQLRGSYKPRKYEGNETKNRQRLHLRESDFLSKGWGPPHDPLSEKHPTPGFSFVGTNEVNQD